LQTEFASFPFHFSEEGAASADDGAEVFSALSDAADHLADVVGLLDWDDAAEEGDVDNSLAIWRIEERSG